MKTEDAFYWYNKTEYFLKLVSMIDDRGAMDHYSAVLLYLYNVEFSSHVDDDINRLEDAAILRRSIHGPAMPYISVLEVLIALAKRCHEDIMYGYEINGEPSSIAFWFWMFMNNAGLTELSDDNIENMHPNEFEMWFNNIVTGIVERTYERNGRGGFFPMQHDPRDQRKIGLWQQLNTYLLENFPL